VSHRKYGRLFLLRKPFRFFVFASQTFQVFCFCFANPSGFSFGPSQKGTICSSALLGMVSWELIPMMLMLEHFEDEQQTHKQLNYLVAYA
jgi:hypothetical protein